MPEKKSFIEVVRVLVERVRLIESESGKVATVLENIVKRIEEQASRGRQVQTRRGVRPDKDGRINGTERDTLKRNIRTSAHLHTLKKEWPIHAHAGDTVRQIRQPKKKRHRV